MYPQLHEVWAELRNQRQEQDRTAHLPFIGLFSLETKGQKGGNVSSQKGRKWTYIFTCDDLQQTASTTCVQCCLSINKRRIRALPWSKRPNRPGTQSEKHLKGDKMWRGIWLSGTVVFLTLFRTWSQLETTDYTQRLAKSTTVNMDQSDWASVHPCDVFEQESQPPTCSRGTAHACVKWKVE